MIILGLFFIFGYFFMIIYIISAIIFLHFYLIYFEEPSLRKRFGDDYITYTKNVPRWFLKKN
jgi:protein-S-isoprenylcysteine O-methyltransferase Ste14